MSIRVTLIAVLLLGSSLSAQGTFAYYGAACQGSGNGPNICQSLNTAGPQRTGTLPNEYGYAVTVTQATTVYGFRYFTSSTTGLDATMGTALYADAGGIPNAVAVAEGSMTVGPTYGAYESYINPPQQIPANTTFWISQLDTTNILASAVTSGTSPPGLTYWRRAGTTWAVTGTITYPAWELICDGGTSPAEPVLAHVGAPTMGANFSLMLVHALPTLPAVLWIGASDTMWRGNPLPLDLTPLGSMGCTLLASDEIQVGGTVDSLGTIILNFPVPSNPALSNGNFFTQWLILDPRYPLPVVTTRAGAGTIR